MVSKQVEAYTDRLQAKEQELISSIAKFENDGRQTTGVDPQDPIDKANGLIAKESFFQQSDFDRAILAHVQAALRRAENGHFGKCVECGQPVEPKRLEAVPWADRCIGCQNLHDEGLL